MEPTESEETQIEKLVEGYLGIKRKISKIPIIKPNGEILKMELTTPQEEEFENGYAESLREWAEDPLSASNQSTGYAFEMIFPALVKIQYPNLSILPSPIQLESYQNSEDRGFDIVVGKLHEEGVKEPFFEILGAFSLALDRQKSDYISQSLNIPVVHISATNVFGGDALNTISLIGASDDPTSEILRYRKINIDKIEDKIPKEDFFRNPNPLDH